MEKTIFADDINKLPEKERLEFYKKEFRYRHCVRSGHEVGLDWVIYDGNLYTRDSYEYQAEEDKARVIKEIKELKEYYRINDAEIYDAEIYDGNEPT